jgi:hypothetical protein
VIFYAMVIAVIFIKRTDHILGTMFFALSFYLGVVEIVAVNIKTIGVCISSSFLDTDDPFCLYVPLLWNSRG